MFNAEQEAPRKTLRTYMRHFEENFTGMECHAFIKVQETYQAALLLLAVTMEERKKSFHHTVMRTLRCDSWSIDCFGLIFSAFAL